MPLGDQKEIDDVVFFQSLEDFTWKGPGKVVDIKGKNIMVKMSSRNWSLRADDAVRGREEHNGEIPDLLEESEGEEEEDSDNKMVEFFHDDDVSGCIGGEAGGSAATGRPNQGQSPRAAGASRGHHTRANNKGTEPSGE